MAKKDKVAVIKLENATDGTENDGSDFAMVDPSEDYLSAKGISFEKSDDQVIHITDSELTFQDTINDSVKLSNFLAKISSNTAPTINDDITTYKEGKIWIKEDTDQIYICVDNTDGAAKWAQINSTYSTITSIFTGFESGLNWSGANNTGYGYQAGKSITTAINCSIFGSGAGYYLNANNNTAIFMNESFLK